jgi:hypothetical protein
MPMWDRYGGRAHVKTSVEGEWGGMWRPGTAANAEAAHACVHGGSGRNGGEAAAGKRCGECRRTGVQACGHAGIFLPVARGGGGREEWRQRM